MLLIFVVDRNYLTDSIRKMFVRECSLAKIIVYYVWLHASSQRQLCLSLCLSMVYTLMQVRCQVRTKSIWIVHSCTSFHEESSIIYFTWIEILVAFNGRFCMKTILRERCCRRRCCYCCYATAAATAFVVRHSRYDDTWSIQFNCSCCSCCWKLFQWIGFIPTTSPIPTSLLRHGETKSEWWVVYINYIDNSNWVDWNYSKQIDMCLGFPLQSGCTRVNMSALISSQTSHFILWIEVMRVAASPLAIAMAKAEAEARFEIQPYCHSILYAQMFVCFQNITRL